METRTISLTFEKALEWYNSDNDALRETALQAFTKEELESFDFKNIKTFKDACKVVGIDYRDFKKMVNNYYGDHIFKYTNIAATKVAIIRQALNKGHYEGNFWYPFNLCVLVESDYYSELIENSAYTEIERLKINGKVYALLGGTSNHSNLFELKNINSNYTTFANSGLLGCATEEIANHFSRYFAKELFDAEYANMIDYEWL